MDVIENAITLLKAQPLAIRVWCAEYFLEVLPGIDATENESWSRLAEETGMPVEMAKCIIRGWMLDADFDIDKLLEGWKR